MDRNVEYILEVARCGGITRAAENLFITPSALSKYVIALEDQLQVKLFHRIGKSFVPTKAGEYYIRRCMEIEQIYQEMGQEMESIACISRRILRLGVQPNLAERVLRFVLPKLQERLPGIRISMHETRGESLISMLKDQNLDVVIAIVGEKEKSLDYQMVSLCENVMAVGYGHPLRQKARTKDGFRYPWIPLELCSSEPNVMLMPGSSYRRFADSLYASYGLTPNVAYQFEATRTGLVCVAHNGYLSKMWKCTFCFSCGTIWLLIKRNRYIRNEACTEEKPYVTFRNYSDHSAVYHFRIYFRQDPIFHYF